MTIPTTPQDRKYTQLDFFAAPAETAQVEDAPLSEEAAAEHVYGPRHDARRRWQALCRRFPLIAQKVATRRWLLKDLDRWLADRRDQPDAQRVYKVWGRSHYERPRMSRWHRLSPVDQRAWREFVRVARRGGRIMAAYAAYATVRGEDPDWLAYARQGDPDVNPDRRSRMARSQDAHAFVMARSAAAPCEDLSPVHARKRGARGRNPDQMRLGDEVEKSSPDRLESLADGLSRSAWRHRRDALLAQERGHHRKAARLEAECNSMIEAIERYRKRAERARARAAEASAQASPTASLGITLRDSPA